MGRQKALMRVERQALALSTRFMEIKVKDNESCEAAGAALNRIVGMEQAWNDHTNPNIARWHDGWKSALEEKARVANELKRAKDWLKKQIGAWKLRLKNEEAQRQAEAEARAVKAAEKDRGKEVKALKQAGEHKEAKQLVKRPVVIAPVVARVQQPILHKISVGERWDFEVIDEGALPASYTKRIPDLPKIRRTVEAMKGETRIAGVRVFAKAAVSAGTSEAPL